MNKKLNAVMKKLNNLKQNVMLKTIIISVMALLLISSITLAWYINNLGLWGMEFNTGNIDFNAYVFSDSGAMLAGPIASNDENESKYMNAPLITINNAEVGTVGTAYILVESTGSIGLQYRIAFDITGRDEVSTAYLGGYKYNISRVTEKVNFSGAGNINVSNCPAPDSIDDEIVTIDRNAVNGTIADKNGYEVYRVDYTLVQKNEEYTGNGIKIYFNIFATQIGGEFEDTEERAYTYYCSTREDIDRARVEAYPGDIIKLSSDIVYYGDLVFNKPISLETNDFTLTVNGNLMYDYVLGNSLKLDAGGLGTIVVQCTQDGVGGNLTIKAPIGEVNLIGANASNGDIIVEKAVTIDATNAYGSAGVSFNEVRIVDLKNSRKTIQLESNTRATVSFGTTVGLIQSVVKANNIEIINNGVIGEINLSNMALLSQTNSPQIYILNNNDINNPILLPHWSVKFTVDAAGKYVGNTRIIQSYSGSPMEISGTCDFDNSDIEVERKDFFVDQIEENNDSRLKIYYQDTDAQQTSIQSILEDYFRYEATTGCTIAEVQELEIISIGNKAVTIEDIVYMNGNNMLALRQLDLQRANVCDGTVANVLPGSAFMNVSKYTELVLPQNLIGVGEKAFYGSKIENIITIPSGVTSYGENWFYNGLYVHFAASVPLNAAAPGVVNARAIFVEEAYISSYVTVFESYENRIYPTSVLDESTQHFIRNTINDEWEITYFVGGEDTVIGNHVTMDGKNLNITSIYDNAYRYTYKGSVVKFADTVENLGANNFYQNAGVKEVDLNNIKTVGAGAFYGCSNLAKVNFGEKLENIGASVFYNCASLNQGVFLPDTMQKIGASAFYRTKITALNAGGTTSIDGAAFYGCSSLVYVQLPNVTVIGENGGNQVFANCTSLVSADMPSLTMAYGEKMFMSCNAMREIYLSSNNDGISLGSTVFSNTTRLKMYVPEAYLEMYQDKKLGGVAATMIYPRGEKMGEELVNGFNIGTYIVADNGDNTCSLITSNVAHTGDLVIPDEFNGKPITAIYANAFRNQTLTNVNLYLGDNLKSIGNYAFYNMSNLLHVEFGASLESIGVSAFEGCTKLAQAVELPATMKTIQSRAFRRTAIQSLNTGGTTYINMEAFYECSSMIYLEMPEVVEVSNGTNGVFGRCTKLVSVSMPKITLGTGYNMFAYCSSLSEVYMASEDESVDLGLNPFGGSVSKKIKVFVPEDLISIYRSKLTMLPNQIYPQGEKMGNTAVNDFVIGDYVVMKNDTGYTLVTTHMNFSGEASVPGTYKGEPITAVYDNAFRNQTFTDAVIYLDNNVTSIGAGAFQGVTGLNSVVMDKVTTIGSDAFNSSSIRQVSAPMLTSVGNTAFRRCTKLEMVSMPKMENMDSTYVLAECTSMKSVYFENILSIGKNVFYGSKKLEKITINRLINEGDPLPAETTIESSAPCKIYVPYRSLDQYQSKWSGKAVVSFDVSATSGGHTYILAERNGRYALIDFVPGSTISALSMPDTVSSTELGSLSIYSIEEGAFAAVASTMKTLTLSLKIAKLDGAALSECQALQTFRVSSRNMFFTAIDGVLYSKDSKMLVRYPVGKSGTFDMTAASYASTVGISAYAFTNASLLTKIILPAPLMAIDSTAFVGCTALKTVEFTGTTPPTLMGAGAFDTSVEGFSVVIPTDNATVVNNYLCAFNFAEYEPYIDLNGNSAPGSSDNRNQVNLDKHSGSNIIYSAILPADDVKKDENTVKPTETTTAPTKPSTTDPTTPTTTAPTTPTTTAPTTPTTTAPTTPTTTAPTAPSVTEPTTTAPTGPSATEPTVPTTAPTTEPETVPETTPAVTTPAVVPETTPAEVPEVTVPAETPETTTEPTTETTAAEEVTEPVVEDAIA